MARRVEGMCACLIAQVGLDSGRIGGQWRPGLLQGGLASQTSIMRSRAAGTTGGAGQQSERELARDGGQISSVPHNARSSLMVEALVSRGRVGATGLAVWQLG